MWYSVLCIVALLLITTRGQFFHEDTTELEENDPCIFEGDTFVWYCKKVTDCPTTDVILKTGAKPRTCNWRHNSSQVICCPPSISQRRCIDYKDYLCVDAYYKGLLNTARKVPMKVRPLTKAGEKKGFKCSIFSNNNTLIELKRGVSTPYGVLPESCQGGFGASGSTGGYGIYVGDLANAAEFPHMALIGYGPPNRISWQCGGSLINERFVLSAAHCSDSTTFGPAKWARLGDLNYLSETDDALPQDFEIVERFVHPDYKPPAYYNDIVLFKLDRDAVFVKYVGPVCLSQDPADPQGSGIATGWGRNESNGPKSPSLMKVDLDFVPSEKCTASVGTEKVVLPQGFDTETMICAGRLGKDTCQGDSGGPLVSSVKTRCLHNQVGVISFGQKRCGETPVPGVYVRVSRFLHWIETIAWSEERFTIPV